MQSIELRKQLLCLCPNYRTILILPFFLFSRSLFLTTDLSDSTDIFSAPSFTLCKTTVLLFDHRFHGFNGLAAGGQSPTIYSCNFLSVSSASSVFVFIQNPFHPHHPCSFSYKIRFISVIRGRLSLIILKFHKFVNHKLVKLLFFFYLCLKFKKLWRRVLSME
jgi:hypothetical protein